MNSKLHRSYHTQLKDAYRKIDKLLLKNCSIINFDKQEQYEQDILIERGKIKKIGKIEADSYDGESIDLAGKLVAPGFFDMHVHFREPGREDEETLMSGAMAAMSGGYTGVCPMPNTEPATDNREIVEFILDKFKSSLLNIYPIAAITKGREGKHLVEMADLVEAGVVAFSDDGASVQNTQVLRRALEYARMFDVLIIEHCEDNFLSAGGVMNEGFISTNLGLKGIPAISEQIIVARNIKLAEYTGGKIHLAHISTAGSVELIRRAKADGVKVTCEATPHHFTLTDQSLVNYDTNLKMNPPLCSEKDVKAVVEGLKDGTIDVIATDHAPHSTEEKELEFDAAPFGIIGLETAIGLMISELIHKHQFSIFEVFEKVAINPYKILGLQIPKIEEGKDANLTIVDINKKWLVDKDKFKSRSRNTPFHQWQLQGQCYAVLNNNFIMINTVM